MRKVLVKTVDIVLFLGCLVAFYFGWQLWGERGVLLALLASAFFGGSWAALSLICEHVERIRINSDKQTAMLDALDYNVAAIGERVVNKKREQFTIS